MAGVVVHAQMFRQARVIRMFVAHSRKEFDGFGAVLEITERLGFQSKVQLASGAFADASDMLHTPPDIIADHLRLLRGRDEFLERTWQSADAACRTLGRQRTNQIKQKIGIRQSLQRGPIGSVNLFLDTAAVKSPVGKSIDREYVTVFPFEPFLEFS